MAAPAAELKVARQILGWDALTMALALRLAGTPEKLQARILDMEAGKRDISGPVQVAIEAFLSGWRPTGWRENQRHDEAGGETPAVSRMSLKG